MKFSPTFCVMCAQKYMEEKVFTFRRFNAIFRFCVPFKNRMTSENLAIVWGGNLLRYPQTEDNEYSEDEAQVHVVLDHIDAYKDVFQYSTQLSKNWRRCESYTCNAFEQYHALQNELPEENNDR
jgi:hypothetical protein